MVDSRFRLLNRLNKAYDEIDTLSDLIAQENIYSESGYIDTDFFIEVVNFLRRTQEVGIKTAKAFRAMLGITEDDSEQKDKKKKDGRKWATEEVLRHCTYTDNVLKLPDVQLSPKSYAEVKKYIAEAGGKWVGGKVQGFTFDFDASRVVSILLKGERCNLQKEFQFFETPSELADWLVSLGGVSSTDTVLEPSAGRGAIIRAVHRAAPGTNVDYYELMPENRQFLDKMDNVTFRGEDFTKGETVQYKRIFANPPFSKNQDIKHVKAMYNALATDGIMCVITSRHWMAATERECVEFRKWIEEISAEIHEIPSGIFKESGTEVATVALKIIRKTNV